MKPPRLLVAAALLAGLLVQLGCQTVITPKTADLQHVHETYTQDFAVWNVPAAADAMAATGPAPGGAFAQSLGAIHDYRLKYPADSQELAHLQVLEGMIYLQSGRFGLAAAVKPDVEAAGAKLASGTGKVVRDRLFAQNFGTLLQGWSETRKENNKDWRTFERVARALAEALKAIPPTQRAAVEEDQGALYLSTSAAVFYAWAYRQITMSADEAQAPVKKAEWFRNARDLIGGFLTEAEKKADISKDLGADVPLGRLRYVQWYHWLDQQQSAP